MLTNSLDEGDCSVSRPGLFTTGTEPNEQEEAWWAPETVCAFWKGEMSLARSLDSM
jgi:hypothetical protein